METNTKMIKSEYQATSKSVSLFDLVKSHDDEIKPRKFYAQLPGLTKVELYPKMGGESDQVDGLRKDGSDAMENKAHLDAQVFSKDFDFTFSRAISNGTYRHKK